MITDDLSAVVRSAVLAARDAGEFSLTDEDVSVSLEMPRNKQHGDYSCNIALALKKATGNNNSRDIADRIVKHLPADDPLIARVEVAGPGFINFYLKPDWLHDTLIKIEDQDVCYGTKDTRSSESILIEFVSANPTGPISVVNGRAAALGDVLGNLLASQGAKVSREFYINDALNSKQIDEFAKSLEVRYLQQLGHPILIPAASPEEKDQTEAGVPQSGATEERARLTFPKDGYRGEYVRDIAKAVVNEVGSKYLNGPDADRERFFRAIAAERMIAVQRNTLEAFGIDYDTWFYESSLYESGEVDKAIAELTERGYTYEQEGALWIRSTAFGDDKDRVLIRSNEKATYVAADTAYHANKFKRGFTHLIDIWGADHHGYVGRLKAGVAELGYEPKDLEIILTQMVSLVRDGEVLIGGKRKGIIQELKEELIDEIGKDAARFYFLLNSYETPATVDIELAKKQSNENPVYYVQYAHARLCNILKKAEEQGVKLLPARDADLSLLLHEAELNVLRKLADYPEDVTLAANDYAPHRLTRYAMDMASLMNVFYENCRVLSGKDDPIEPELTAARLTLVNGARIVLHNLLTLLGITAPEKM